jgi:hypothetical protein
VNRYNVSAQSIQRLFFLSRYNDSQTVIMVHAKNIFFNYFRRSILKWSPHWLKKTESDPTSQIITPESLLAIYKVREIILDIETLN